MMIIFLVTCAITLCVATLFSRTRGKRVAEALLLQADKESEALRHKTELAALESERKLTEARHQQEREQAVAEERLKAREKQLAKQLGKLKLLEAEAARVSKLSKAEARSELLAQVEAEASRQIEQRRNEAKQEADREAARIIGTAINRLAVACVSEATVTTVSLPSDEMKGRIIGREGRNIRSFETLTGVNVIIDDTPSAVVLSGMDPIRRHIAKHALTDLVLDGRIHPTQIEEAVKRAQEGVDEQVKRAGEEAALKAGVHGLHAELIRHLGLLTFRFSYGQRVLEHSIEVASLLGMMCAELGIDEALGRRIGLLHDVGKAITHEKGLTHAMAGADLARKCGEREEVANGIASHHNEVEPSTVEGSLCGAADALSGGRPGARIEAVDSYVQRIEKLERLALELPGVTRAFALQAGRELRVVVEPSEVDDKGASALAQRLAQIVEQSLTYPGKIRITVMRDRRAISYAY